MLLLLHFEANGSSVTVIYHTHLQLDLGVSLLTLSTSCALCQKKETNSKKKRGPFITVFHFHFKMCSDKTGLEQIP